MPRMIVTRLYLVRHGATPLTEEDRFTGAANVELSDDGRWQAERLGERLRDEKLTAVYCSPMARTVEDAAILLTVLSGTDPRDQATTARGRCSGGENLMAHGAWDSSSLQRRKANRDSVKPNGWVVAQRCVAGTWF
jgi:probable phosphoglycerate mutase